MTDPKPPSPETLAKYGLTAEQWLAILESQGNVCPICEKEPKTGRWVVDHEHLPRYKKLKPELRRAAIRGVTCWWCNKTHLGRGITINKAIAVVAYLEAYARRSETF